MPMPITTTATTTVTTTVTSTVMLTATTCRRLPIVWSSLAAMTGATTGRLLSCTGTTSVPWRR